MCNGFISGNSISLPGKKNILSVNLLNKSLKRKVYNYLLNSQSAKIITVALLKELSVFPFSHISFVREYWTVSGPCSLLKSKSIRQILGNFHNSYFCLQKPFGYNEDQRQKPLFFFRAWSGLKFIEICLLLLSQGIGLKACATSCKC